MMLAATEEQPEQLPEAATSSAKKNDGHGTKTDDKKRGIINHIGMPFVWQIEGHHLTTNDHRPDVDKGLYTGCQPEV